MKTICIIPARGGSKRIERKNIKDFVGKPVIAYSIEAALTSGCFDEVMVSTDDEEIAHVAVSLGASVPFMRSERTADDFATTADVISEVLDRYAEEGNMFDVLCCLYATAPFVTAQRLREAHKILAAGDAKAAFTCVEYSYPVQRCLTIGSDGHVAMKFPQYAASRSQDLEKTYHDAGQFYFSTVDEFRRCGSLWGPDTIPVVLPEIEAQDLDTPQDWELAELKYRFLHKDAVADTSCVLASSSDALPSDAATAGIKHDILPAQIELDHYLLVSYNQLDEDTLELVRGERNREDVRKWSINRDEISKEQHESFVSSLSRRDDQRYYAVYNRYHELVGSVNLKKVSEGRLDRGIWILSDRQGLGYASSILGSLYEWLSANSTADVVETTVRVDNEASVALEERLGARETGRDSEFIHYEFKL